MNCLKCNYRNPGTVGFCQKCGARMDFTADEIAGSLVETAREETAKNTEYYAKQALMFSAILFLISLTLFVLSLGAPEESYYIPSLSRGAEHVKVETKIEPQIPKLDVPIEFRKK